ncbi:MAG: hypothetical protein WAS33_16760 [Candidatus Promineifilaceae bacterium]|nr:hypothetical protein [Flavobacteriales bacterium]
MINSRTFQNFALALLLGVSGNVVFINHCSAQRSISVSSFLGKVGTTYTKEVRGGASTYGYSGYSVQLLYSEPVNENTEAIVGLGYHVQNLGFNVSDGSQCCTNTDSITVRASYVSLIFGISWFLDEAKKFSLFLAAQLDNPITNNATGRRRYYVPLSVDIDTLINGKLKNYGHFNFIPTIGLNYQRPVNATYQWGIGCYFQYGITPQWDDHLRTGEGGIRIFLKRNFIKKIVFEQHSS